MDSKKKKLEPIPYQCDNCGAKVSAYGEIPRCLGCGKNLCSICNNYLLCPQDFHKLDPKDQKKIKRFGYSLENVNNSATMFKIFPIILGMVGLVFIILLFVLQEEIFNFVFGFLGGFLLLAGLMMYGVFHNFEEREYKRVSTQIRNIILPYNISPAYHNQELYKKQIKDSNEFDEDKEEDQVIICPTCGEEIKDSSKKFCENCGERGR
jgi:hypothetical protein